MNPARSERKSRRSSILKPPKPRQPLQNVELNVSSTENSPATTTTKVKRRVSFAEKKHVKEFCDSMEQGTMWDNTYEENELSQAKNNQNSNNDENVISDDGVNQLAKKSTEIDEKSVGESEISDANLIREKSRVSIVTESVVSITQSVNADNGKVIADSYYSAVEREFNLVDSMGDVARAKPSGIPFPTKYSGSLNARRSLSVTEDVFRKSTNKGRPLLSESVDARLASTTIIASGFQNSANFDPPTMQDDDCSEVPMEETLIEDVLVNPTVPTSLSVSKSLPVLKTSFNVIPNMDFFQNDKISGHLPVRRVSSKSEKDTRADDKENPKKLIDPTNANEGQMIGSKDQSRISVYRDTSMEMTESVPNRMSMIAKHQPNKLGDKESSEWPLVAEQTTNFQIKTAETVTKILGLSGSSFKDFDRNKIVLRPERMSMFRNKSVESGEGVKIVSNTQKVQKLPSERAAILCDKTVDFTEVVENMRSTEKPRETAPELTTIFHDKSVELTEAVHNVPGIDQLQKLPPERPTIFHDESVNRNEVVRTGSRAGKPQQTSQEPTTLFHDKSLDFTAVVGSSSSYENTQKPPPEKTTIFQNQSVDMTEVVRSSSSCENSQKPPPEKTTIFQNQSVDMTEVVRSRPSYEKLPPEKTAIFHNQSMDMTEVVRGSLNCENSQKPPPEKTTIFHDQSVDMTEIVRIHPSCGKLPPEKTTIFNNQSVDMTEVVRSRPSYEKLPLEKTTIFHNQSVETTEVVRSSSSCENLQKQPPEKTTIFHNQSVDMTEAVRSRPSSEKPPPETTTIFNNQSVDMTEAVRNGPSNENQPPEKTTIFHNQSVDMTEVVRSRTNCEKPPPEKTTIFHDQSVDMTEVVRSRPSYEKPPPEKTTIFHNHSVDMTEVVRSSSSCENQQRQPPEKTTIFQNQSVDMTEVVRSHPSHEKPPPEKTTIFHNQSVDMTEVIRSSSSCESQQKQPPEKTTIFQNQSVDMNEVTGTRLNSTKLPSNTAYHDKSTDTIEMIPSGVSIQNPVDQILEEEVPPSRSQTTSVSHNKTAGLTNAEIENENEQSENQSLELHEALPRGHSVSEVPSKQKSLNVEEAKRLIASIEMKNFDPEVRSPVSKRMKSLGSRKSIDVTAAVPFVVYRKLARQQCDQTKSANSEQPSAKVNPETTSSTEEFRDKSMDMTEMVVGSSSDYTSRTLTDKSVENVPHETREKTTNLQNKSMEMTEAIPCHPFEVASQKCTDSNDDYCCQQSQDTTLRQDDSMEITIAIPGILKAKATIFHDESMELTGAVNVTTKIHPVTNRIPDRAPKSQFQALPASESKTVVFRDDLMELTSGVKLSSQPIAGNRTAVEDGTDPWSNDIQELERDGKTMVYRDDSMELTKAVSFPSQAQTDPSNKENCPLGMEDLQRSSSRRSEKKDSVGVSKNEWLEMMKSVQFLSSERNKENRTEPTESEEQRGNIDSEEITRDIGSEDITGVVPFATEIDDDNGKGKQLETVDGTMRFESEKMEMTDGIRWSSAPNVEKPKTVCDDADRQKQLPAMETCSPVEKPQQRQSQVAKELFQKSLPDERAETVNKNSTASSETTDLDAEIRKLAESFTIASTVNESGFDEATFLRQQARCMEDYEANSTASQEYNSGTLSARKNAPIVEKRDCVDPARSDGPKDSAGNEEPALPTVDKNASKAKANTSVRDNDNSIADSNRSSRVDREQYDRSLEELRCRAYTVSKFRPEVTGYELTAAISMADVGKHHESIFAVEPPSFVFADSISMEPVIDRAASINELPTESSSFIVREKMETRKSLEISLVSIDDLTQTTKPLRNDKPEVEDITDIADVTMTLETDVNKSASDLKNENTVERPELKHRGQTFVIKRPSTDGTISIPSSPETEKTETKNDRVSGVTTAAEFTSESPNGPNEKIRRRDSALTNEYRRLPTVDKEGIATELIEIGCGWGNRNFANSTVIGDDFTRQFVRPGVEETSIVLEIPLADEMTAENVEKCTNRWSKVEEPNEIVMETEISVTKSPFDVLKDTVESLAKRPETIWNINRLDERIVAFNFFSKSIVLAIYLNDSANSNSSSPIKVIGFLSQLVEEGTDPGLCLAHSLIMKKVNSASLTSSYKTFDEVSRLLDYVTAEVKLGMDFMFELERLRDRTVMKIRENRITFTVRTRDPNGGIILSITMVIKPFEDINSNDITVACLLGREKVRENDIKRLITNVKRDHRFLRFYINDVRDYIDLMALTGSSGKTGSQ